MATDTFTASEESRRLDIFLAENYEERSRSSLANLVRLGEVTLNGRPAKPSTPVSPGDIITVTFPPPRPTTLEKEPGHLEILYRDDDILVINKPAGICVHPGAGRTTGTIVNRLLALGEPLSIIGGVERPGIVHRLDKETTGCLLVALNDSSHVALSRAFKEREIHKTYVAIVQGRAPFDEKEVDAPVGRHPRHRKKMTIRENGRQALSRIICADRGLHTSLLIVKPVTGRTHQIRVHLAHIHFSVVGDEVYGIKRGIQAPRQALHAWKIAFRHPRSGDSLTFTAPLPEDMVNLMSRENLALPTGEEGVYNED